MWDGHSFDLDKKDRVSHLTRRPHSVARHGIMLIPRGCALGPRRYMLASRIDKVQNRTQLFSVWAGRTSPVRRPATRVASTRASKADTPNASSALSLTIEP